MNEEAKKNMDLVNSLIAEAGVNKGQDLQQGNKKLVAVTVNYEADSGAHFEGVVFFRRPSAMDYVRMGALKSELLRVFGVRPITELIPNGNGGFMVHESMAHVDESVKFIARAISTCDVLLVQPIPAWFINHREIEDTDLLIEIYNGFDNELSSFRRGSQGGPAGDSQAGASTENVAHPEVIRERDLDRAGRDTPTDGPALTELDGGAN